MKDRQRKVLELLDKSGARLHGLLGRLTLREDVVGDLMQELFIRLSNSKGLDKATNSYAYAWRVAVNLAFQWRRNCKMNFQSLEENSLPAENSPSALENMIRKEDLEQILDATSRLKDLARDVVVMRYIEQASYEEIAQRFDKKPQHIRSLCAKALARIRTLLAIEKIRPVGKE